MKFILIAAVLMSACAPRVVYVGKCTSQKSQDYWFDAGYSYAQYKARVAVKKVK